MKLSLLVVALSVSLMACSSPGGDDASDAAVWVSSDGEEWERVCHPSLGGPGEQQMLGVTATDSLLVAVGSEVVDGDRDGVVWLSEDGRDWRRSDSEDLGGSGEQWIVDVAFTDVGLVAVGSVGRTRDQDAAFWTSDEGVVWDRAAAIPSFGGAGHQSVNSVVQSGGVVLAGGQNVNDGILWQTDDGSTWEKLDSPGLTGEGIQGVFGLTVTGRGILAVGESDNDGAVWLSDGSDWEIVNEPKAFGGYGRQRVNAVTAADQQVVAVGGDFSYDRIFLGGGSEGSLDGAVWAMGTDGSWMRVGGSDAFEGIGEQAANAVIPWEAGFMAVGYDLAGRGSVEEGIAEFGSGLDVDAAVWLSGDGVEWAKVIQPDFGGEDWQDMWDVVEVPGVGLVAVGGDDLATACG